MAFLKFLTSAARCMKSNFSQPSKRLQSSLTFTEESIARYCVGGYHPVKIGDLLNQGKYKVISKLGYGVYSTVWLVFDLKSKQHVALKILTADTFGQGRDTFEIDILRHIRSDTTPDTGKLHILQLLDNFEHQGPNGNHVCLVFQAMGPDMSNSVLSPRHMSSYTHWHMFRDAPSEAFEPSRPALAPPLDFYIESAQVSCAEEDLAHSTDTDISVMLADFGTASWFDKHLTDWIQPPMLRAPEVILEAKWDCKVDIWNLGLIIWELAEGSLLFDGMWTPSGSYSPEAHLAQMTAVFGSMPSVLLGRSKNRDEFFDSDGKLLKPSIFPPCSLEKISNNDNFPDLEKKRFLDFIGSMVRLDPEQRLDAKGLLDSPWLALSI
ncbi:hypothetical protein ED733_000552 [Metarhizium rileyi]|uniref:non-specific serine/threonine protein kinase n=1 Tax=Metarhizium rileyi (strain RCEF 4871) TaxID=1649241 RepID=A0A5C6GBR2_METRR|nr:hypothetical protein ED733_000552 [Metarhizium rileyi]